MKCLLVLIASFSIACGSANTPKPLNQSMQDPLVSACNGGAVKSCLMAGDDAERKGSIEAAVMFYKRACDLGESNGCLLAGGLLIQTEASRDEGLALLDTVCKSGDPTGCYGAGLVVNGDLGGPGDAEAAVPLFMRACDAGLAAACGKLGIAYLEGEGVERDADRGLRMLEDACSRGDGTACHRLGERHADAEEPATAADFYRKACLAGEGIGCTHLGFAYAEGRGVEIDPASARDYFGRGCNAEVADPRGCTMLGWSEWSGIGGETRTNEGQERLDEACSLDGLACYYLARIARSEGKLSESQAHVDEACQLTPSMCDWFRRDIQGRR